MTRILLTIVIIGTCLPAPRSLAVEKVGGVAVFGTESSLCPSPFESLGLWMVSTRHLTPEAAAADVESPALGVTMMDESGNRHSIALDDFFSSLRPERPVIVHVHGNRITEQEANGRGRFVRGQIGRHVPVEAADFVVFSWPSEKTGILVKDGRSKARMTEAEGLYLGWLLRELVRREIPVAVIAYSFGCRVTTGALHALAGGCLSGRSLPGDSIRGAQIPVALVAPALDTDWLGPRGYHGLAGQNISRMVLLYNSRDAVLKRYWMIERGGHSQALGYTGPRYSPLGYDGSPIPLTVRDCTATLGRAHNEVQYYAGSCGGGALIATLLGELLSQPAPLPSGE